MERERLSSRLGFILISAGCAIGCGNVWKFPWMTGQNGGAAFVVVYLICLALLGLPVLTMEFSVGRAAQKSPIYMYQAITPGKKGWPVHGAVCLIGNVILMMFYTIITGWLLYYFYSSVTGKFVGMNGDEVGAYFGNMLATPQVVILFTVIICILGFFVLSFSLKGGLERVTKVMMIALIIIMVVMAGNSFTLAGAKEGLSFYLVPDFSKINVDVVVAAMNQAFFTLSVGMGSMAIFGSYLGKDHALLGESVSVIVLDTIVALTAGLIIFPACFTYNVEPGAGPALIFITLPNIFLNMPLGRFWGSLFFLFMTFAAFSTVLAVFENILAGVRELTDWSRSKASFICCIGMIILALPCALGPNVLKSFQPFGPGSEVLDLEDFIVSNCILPLGSLTFVLYCTSKLGWGWEGFVSEANTGEGLKISNKVYPYCKYILPVIIFIIFALGIKAKFFA